MEHSSQPPQPNRIETWEIEVGEAEDVASPFTIDPRQWLAWFQEAIDHWKAKVVACYDQKDATRKINLGYHILRKPPGNAYRGRIRLAQRGRLVYIIPQLKKGDSNPNP